MTTDKTAPLLVEADTARLVQCVGNILANAIKYTDPLGMIGPVTGSLKIGNESSTSGSMNTWSSQSTLMRWSERSPVRFGR